MEIIGESSSVKELWGIVDGLANSRRRCLVVGKNGNSQKPGEPTGKPQEAKKSEQFQLLIFGDGITKAISPLANTSCELFDRWIKRSRSIRACGCGKRNL